MLYNFINILTPLNCTFKRMNFMEREQYLSSTRAFFPDVFLDYCFSSIKALLKYLLSENFKHPTTLLALLIPFILLYLLIPVVCVSFQHDLYFTYCVNSYIPLLKWKLPEFRNFCPRKWTSRISNSALCSINIDRLNE